MPTKTNSKTLTENTNDIWGTPPNVFLPLHKIFGFTLDVCANAENTKVERFYSFKQNSLVKSWDKENGTANWANIPFSSKNVWFKKAHDEAEQGAVIALLTTMDSLTNKDFQAHRKYVSHIFIFNGRIKFIGATNGQAFNKGNVLVIYNGHKVSKLNELHTIANDKSGDLLGMLLDYTQFSPFSEQRGADTATVIQFPQQAKKEKIKMEKEIKKAKEKKQTLYHDLKTAVAPLVNVLNRGERVYYRLPNGESSELRAIVKSTHKEKISEPELIVGLAKIFYPKLKGKSPRLAVEHKPCRELNWENGGMIIPYALIKKSWELVLARKDFRWKSKDMNSLKKAVSL